MSINQPPESLGITKDKRAEYDKEAQKTLYKLKMRHEKFKKDKELKDGSG